MRAEGYFAQLRSQNDGDFKRESLAEHHDDALSRQVRDACDHVPGYRRLRRAPFVKRTLRPPSLVHADVREQHREVHRPSRDHGDRATDDSHFVLLDEGVMKRDVYEQRRHRSQPHGSDFPPNAQVFL